MARLAIIRTSLHSLLFAAALTAAITVTAAAAHSVTQQAAQQQAAQQQAAQQQAAQQQAAQQQAAQQDITSYTVFSKLLADLVDSNGMVDYAGFAKSDDFNDYLISITKADLGSMEKNERLAFLLNAYNAYVIKIVLDHFPIDSPKEIEGFFTEVRCSIGGMQLTLNELRQRYLLPLGGAYIYFGITFAAKGGPRLVPRAYNALNLHEQLRTNAREFASNATKIRLEKGKKTLYLSEMLRWYEADFTVEFGSVLNFVKEYSAPEDIEFLIRNPVAVRYIDFDWDLNLQRNI